MAERKGARSVREVDPEVLAGLNAGTVQTLTLPELLALDFTALLRAVLPHADAASVEAVATAPGVTKKMLAAGQALHRHHGAAAFETYRSHPSDTVRGWAAFALGEVPGMDLGERLRLVRCLADDPHFGVREWAWMGIRRHIGAEPEEAVRLLTAWTADPSPNVRRFASEATRPRGVWCAHIDALRRRPQIGLPLLEPLRSDTARYVQDSVANWLNDAARSCPAWVREVCRRWQAEGAAERICKRAQRSLADVNEAPTAAEPVGSLLNLGPKSATWLAEVGIHTRADLAGLGAVVAFRMVRQRRKETTLNLLYALHGALTDTRWDRLSVKDRERLRRQAEAG